MEGDTQTVVVFLAELHKVLGTSGWVAMLGVFFASAIQIYRMPWAQGLLSGVAGLAGKYTGWLKVLLWDNLTPLGKTLLVLGFSGVGGFLASLGAGLSWAPALGAAFAAVVGSMGSRKAFKGLVGGTKHLLVENSKAAYEAGVATDMRKTSLKVEIPNGDSFSDR